LDRRRLTGNITVKNIYSALISTQDYPIWRGWKVNLWKWNLQLKIKLFIWMAAENRILSWDVLQKKGWEGPGICFLCAKTVLKISTTFSFIALSLRQFGPELHIFTKIKKPWAGTSL
jgi:hypothetical protein